MTEQAGLYAGTDGFHVTVGGTTSLIGAVMDSQTQKNAVTTKSLIMKDITNEAGYTDETVGVSFKRDTYAERMKEKEFYNQKGLTPNLMPGSRGKTSSTTYAAIADGYLKILDKKISPEEVRRNTKETANTLQKIFDKTDVQERQELAKLFAKNANNLLHNLKDDGSPRKVALHAAVGAITQAIAGNGALAGAVSAGVNEAVIKEIEKLAKKDPAGAQLLSATLGYAVNKAIGESGLAGASTAQYGTKWNGLSHYQQNYHNDAIYKYLFENNNREHIDGIIKVLESAVEISNQNKEMPDMAEENMIYELERSARILKVSYKYDYQNGLTGNILTLLSMYRDKLPNRDILSFNGGIGVGIRGKSYMGAIKGDFGVSSHLDYDSRRKGLAIISRAGIDVGVGKNISIGIEGLNVAKANNIHDNENSVQINAGRSFKVIGKASIYNNDRDIELNVGGGIYFGAGFEGSINFNTSAAWDKLNGKKRGKDLLNEELKKLLEGYNK